MTFINAQVTIDPADPKKIGIIIDYGADKPRAEGDFNALAGCSVDKKPIRIMSEQRGTKYDVIVTDGHLKTLEMFNSARAYLIVLKGEIVNEQ